VDGALLVDAWSDVAQGLSLDLRHLWHPLVYAAGEAVIDWRASLFPDNGPYRVRTGMEDGECRNGAGSLPLNSGTRR
jgi:hypothetical protein